MEQMRAMPQWRHMLEIGERGKQHIVRRVQRYTRLPGSDSADVVQDVPAWLVPQQRVQLHRVPAGPHVRRAAQGRMRRGALRRRERADGM